MREGVGIDERVEGDREKRERLWQAPRERSSEVSRLELDGLLYTKR
jgi:hypothetical protein